jgi:predicted enzyme related to lactoylglutathione lyase
MSTTTQDLRIDYIEFPATDLAATKLFYTEVFGWTFTDYGPAYTAFSDGRVEGGFTTQTPVRAGGPLVVIYAVELERARGAVEAAGGRITTEPFTFPGGRRFHFADPNGNEIAVWSER